MQKLLYTILFTAVLFTPVLIHAQIRVMNEEKKWIILMPDGSYHYEQLDTAKAIHKAMFNEPSIDWLLENQDKIVHKYFQMGLDGKI